MSLSKLIKTAKSALDKMDNGKKFPTSYVINRLEVSSQSNPSDQLIGNMRDVLTKVASKQPVISQKEIADLYNKMYGFSNGNSAFRYELNDLLPEGFGSPKSSEKAHHSKRASDEAAPVSLSEDSDTVNAFSRIFSLGANKSFGTYDKNLVKKAEKLTSIELSSANLPPASIDIVGGNEHFILCSASYKNSDFTTSSVKIPVQISNGVVTPPKAFISGDSLEPITKEALLVELKSQSLNKKASARSDFEEQRASYRVTDYVPVTPSALKDMIDVEEVLTASASGLPEHLVKKASRVVFSELTSIGAFNPQIKLASSEKNRLAFAARIPTTSGYEDVVVPVEVSGDLVNLPSKFYTLNKNSYDFSHSGFQSFTKEAGVISEKSAPFFRDSDELNKLSYSQLFDKITAAVAISDYKLAEDALTIISDKFGPERFKIALNDFQSLIKNASKTSDDSLVKEALKRGDLIKTANSIELFCPKLGLPLSKIDFDKNGRPVPKHRSRAENLESLDGVGFTTSKIFFN